MSNDSNNTDALGNTHVSWMFELAVKEGRSADLRALSAEMSEATLRNEPGTLDYEWYLSDDERTLHLFERYADAEAALIHMHTFDSKYVKRFFEVLVPKRITLYGAVDERVSGGMKDLAPQVLRRASGFSR